MFVNLIVFLFQLIVLMILITGVILVASACVGILIELIKDFKKK